MKIPLASPAPPPSTDTASGGKNQQYNDLLKAFKAQTNEIAEANRRGSMLDVKCQEYESERKRLQDENEVLEKEVHFYKSSLHKQQEHQADLHAERVDRDATDVESGFCIITPSKDDKKGRMGAPVSLVLIWSLSRQYFPIKCMQYVPETPPVLGLQGQLLLIAYICILQILALMYVA